MSKEGMNASKMSPRKQGCWLARRHSSRCRNEQWCS